MTIASFMRDYGYVAVWITQVFLGVVTWLFRKNVATKEDLDGVSARVTDIEEALKLQPSAKDVARLAVDMERVRGEMKTFTATINGARETFTAKLDGASSLLSRTETQLRMITEHLLANRG